MRELLAEAADRLRAAGVGSPEVDARLLAAWLLDAAPLTVHTAELPAWFDAEFAAVVERRAQRHLAIRRPEHVPRRPPRLLEQRLDERAERLEREISGGVRL